MTVAAGVMLAIPRDLVGKRVGEIAGWVHGIGAAGGIVLTGVSAGFLAYVCYSEPFNDGLQNARSKAVHAVHVLILFVNFYYRAEAENNPTEATQIAVPAYIQITAVTATVVCSTAMLAF